MWETIGPPLYYCAECLRAVSVTAADPEPIVARACDHADAQIIAPRNAICVGEGGLSFADQVRVSWRQVLAYLTGRCV
jgi:hypothetical protein